MALRFVLNGHPVETAPSSADASLLAWLRARGLTGTKEGCAEGECGACAVAMLARDAQGRTRFEAVNSCLVPLAAVEGRSVVTVEGVAGAGGSLHPVQAALARGGGSQCGYCTPGFVISLFCEYYREGRSAPDREAISGNLCRCTGYRPILDVLRALPQVEPGDPVVSVLAKASLQDPLIPPVDTGALFMRPTRLDEVFQCLALAPGAVVIAGGTDMMVTANAVGPGPAGSTRWVSLGAVPELRRFEVSPDAIVIGASLPLSVLEERLREEAPGVVPLLEHLLPLFSSRLIKNRATLGGNLGTASPIGDAHPVLLALDARVVIASARGRRELPVSEFFLGYRKTALAPDELVIEIVLPRPLAAVQRFYKVSKRVLDDISTVSAAFSLDLTDARRVARLRVAYGGVAATPLRAVAAEDRAVGQLWTRSAVEALLPLVERIGSPLSDLRGSAAYRCAMMGRLLEKFFHETAAAVQAAE